MWKIDIILMSKLLTTTLLLMNVTRTSLCTRISKNQKLKLLNLPGKVPGFFYYQSGQGIPLEDFPEAAGTST